MTGIERITDKIIQDAYAKAAKIERDTENECVQIIEDYKKEATLRVDEINARAADYALSIRNKAQTEINLIKKNTEYDTYAEICESVYESARRELLNLQEDKYRLFILNLIVSRVKSLYEENVADIKICLSEKDLLAHGNYISEQIINLQKNKTLQSGVTLDQDFVDISAGFILKTPKFDVDSSIEALIDEIRDKTLQRVLKTIQNTNQDKT